MSEPTAQKAAKGQFPHVFTDEERRRGAARTAEVRRERAKSHSERLRDKLEAIEGELLETVFEQAKSDWRAVMALYDRAYGTPAKAEPERTEIEIVAGEVRGTTLMDMLNDLNELSQSPDNPGLNGDNPS